MRRKIYELTGAILALGSLPAAAGEPDAFVLEISGTEPMAFRGECTVRDFGQTHTLELSGVTPVTRRISGSSLSCTFRPESSRGVLYITAQGAGTITRSSANGPGSRIAFRIE